ncbi:hypothetical protein HZH68_006904 [Vespula germanica]|uniref:Uncharacterized protein n=1 Tax=Vespula germanica TaxID=30212 RepID=A0A834KA28_VESGE|nr:hypothetical protein HZH68_006904 [Vespula germanica]
MMSVSTINHLLETTRVLPSQLVDGTERVPDKLMASEEGPGPRLAPAAARPPDYRPQNPLHSRSHLGCVVPGPGIRISL